MELFEDPEVLNSQQKIKELVSVVSTKEATKTILKASPEKFLCIFFLIIIPLSFLQFLLESNNLELFVCISDTYYTSSLEYLYANSLFPYKRVVATYSSYYIFLKQNSIPYYCVSLVLFFAFYLLSISATTFTVATFNLSKPLSHVSILSSVPGIFKHLAIAFCHAIPIIFLNYIAYLAVLTLFCMVLTLIRTIPKINHVLVFVTGFVFLIIYFFFVFVVHGNFIAWWNLANLVSVLEPNMYGSRAIKKSKQLLQEKKFISSYLAFLYFAVVIEIASIGKLVMNYDMNIKVRVFICSLFVLALAVLNFLGLIVQNLRYYQNQVIVLNECVLQVKGFVSIKMKRFVGDDNRAEGNQLEV